MRQRIEPRLPEVGRIRLGTRQKSRSGKMVPTPSAGLVFSSESKGTLAALCQIVGGQVEAWPDGPEPWRLISTVSSLSVQVPPQLMTEPAYELWSAAGLLRRCDGETCEVPVETPDGPVIEQVPCQCDGVGECKPTSRLRVVIPQVPGIGVWIVTTHSAIAAGELSGQRRLLEAAGATLVPAVIAIEHERTRRGSEVPVLRLRFKVGLEELGVVASRPAAQLGKGE